MHRTPFTQDELRQISDEVWQDPPESGQKDTSAHCPVCGAIARVLFSWSSSGEDGPGPALLSITCLSCDRHGKVSEKARCPEFSKEDMRAFVELFERGLPAHCTECGTQLRWSEAHTIGGRSYAAYCYRGRAMGKIAFERGS